jgi:predicted TIM-barrel fold metal-dependent hydrolase
LAARQRKLLGPGHPQWPTEQEQFSSDPSGSGQGGGGHIMGYVDADAHVFESAHAWEFFDPDERDYAPPPGSPLWQVEDFTVLPGLVPREGDYSMYPEGTQDLQEVGLRLAEMDRMTVDVQMCFSTFWLMHDLRDPIREAAMQRSWNRWMAERTGESEGRLRWFCQVPMRDRDRMEQELVFAKENGAVGVETTGVRYDLPLGHPFFWPLYERLQDLDLVLAVHVGGSNRVYLRHPQSFYYNHILPVPGAFHNLIAMDVPKRFPALRVAFCEAGGSWVPHALSEKFRTNDRADARVWGDWRARSREYLADANLYVSCLLDDDLSYLTGYIGEDRMMIGSDYSHVDAGTDPDALRIVAKRTDVVPEVLEKILHTNARRCFGVDPAFRPTFAEPTSSNAGPGF